MWVAVTQQAYPGQQETPGHRRDGGQRDGLVARVMAQPGHRLGERVERFAGCRQQGLAGAGEHQLARFAHEQGDAQVLLQLPQLVADGGGCHRQFLRPAALALR